MLQVQYNDVGTMDILSSIHQSFLTAKNNTLPDAANEWTPSIVFDLSVPQMEFFEMEDKYGLFVAGMGSGKSMTMALCAVRDLVNFKGANVAVYAPTFDLLSLIIVPYISETLNNAGFNFAYNGGNHIFSVSGFGKIICRSLDTPRRIVGYETFRAHADEIDTLPYEKANEAWNKIIARNRQKVYVLDDSGRKIPDYDENLDLLKDKIGNQVYKMHLNRVCAYTTPEGWNFAYRRWIKDKKNGDGYRYVTASTYSNSHNLPPDYIENLRKSYPPELAEAYIDGKFTNLTAGRVYKSFCRVANASHEFVRDDDVLHVGMDFNVEHGAAVIHVERSQPIYDKNGEYIGDEITDHAVDEIVDSYDTENTIKILLERYPHHAMKIYPDASGKKRSSSSTGVDSKGKATKTDLYLLKKQENWEVVVGNSNPPIKDRVSSYSARICDGTGTRRYFVNIEKCPSVTDTLEQQVWKNGIPDKSTGLDHLGDAGGYCMYKKYPVIKASSGFVRVYSRNRQ